MSKQCIWHQTKVTWYQFTCFRGCSLNDGLRGVENTENGYHVVKCQTCSKISPDPDIITISPMQ